MFAKVVRIIVLLSLAMLAVGGVRRISENNSQNITLRPLDLDPAHPGKRRLGDLIFLAAWELESDNEDFGGISALVALPGGRFIGVSDAGALIGFGLTGNGRAIRPFIGPLPGSQGPNRSYKDRDSEGIVHDRGSGQFWVSYEARHAIRRFALSLLWSTGIVKLKGHHDWADNKGAEAIIRLPDDRFVVIAENLENGVHEGLLFSGDPVERGTSIAYFSYRPPDGYRVTDGTMLPDGRMLILNRAISFPSGFSAKLAVVTVRDFMKNATVEGRVIATLATPLLVDNLEGIAITREGDATTIWLISDNNFNIWQRTLLMKFRLPEPIQTEKPEAFSAPGF